MPTTTPNGPAYRSKAGALELTVWANELDDGGVSFTTSLVRNYRLPPEKRDGADDNGWRKTNSLRACDLLFAAEMLRVARLRIGLLEAINHLSGKEN